MSGGGWFEALSDEHLTLILEKDFFDDFTDGKLAQDSFSEQDWYWYELTELLDEEDVRGELIEKLFEETGYAVSYLGSDDVKAVAEALSNLTTEDIRQRFDAKQEIMQKISYDTILVLVRGLTAFYQKAAKNNHAVLFTACP